MNEKNIAIALKMPCGECHTRTNERVNLKGSQVEWSDPPFVVVEEDRFIVRCRMCGTEPVPSSEVGNKEEFIERQVAKRGSSE